MFVSEIFFLPSWWATPWPCFKLHQVRRRIPFPLSHIFPCGLNLHLHSIPWLSDDHSVYVFTECLSLQGCRWRMARIESALPSCFLEPLIGELQGEWMHLLPEFQNEIYTPLGLYCEQRRQWCSQRFQVILFSRERSQRRKDSEGLEWLYHSYWHEMRDALEI